ncbi:MAG: erythromycin esterase family protein [Bacteroidota bacterium]
MNYKPILLAIVLISSLFGFTTLQAQTPILSQKSWQPLLEDVGDHAMVGLGEETHWVETYLEVKEHLIPVLHQQKGFNVLIFESGFINAFTTNIDGLQGRPRLEGTLYDLWQTQSTLRLMEYLDQAPDILQIGCDLKGPPSFAFSQYLQKLYQSIGYSEIGRDAYVVDSTFTVLRTRWEPAIGEADRGVYLADSTYQDYRLAYREMQRQIGQEQVKVQREMQLSNKDFQYFLRCFDNRIALLDLMQAPTYQKKHLLRDSMMAQNIRWITETYAPKRKYMLWGADIHLSKDAAWEDLGSEWTANYSMVEWLLQESEVSIYSIGIKPKKSLDKSLRSNFSGPADWYFVPTANIPSFKRQHDALIICRRTKPIKQYLLSKND